MTEDITTALITRLQPLFYFIGLAVVLAIVSFGGTIVNLFLKSRRKEEDTLQERLKSLEQSVNQSALALVRIEVKLEFVIDKYNKDLINLGKKIRDLQI